MAKSIWKIALAIEDSQDVRVPIGAEFLCVQVQREELCLWALVDPLAGYEKRRIYVYGTGHPIERGPLKYIWTVQMHSGSLVWHVFEEVK